MKLSTLLLFCMISMLAFSQKVIQLSVNQPPEFGFSIARTDTTILKTTSVVLGTDLVVFGGSGDYQFLWSPAETLNDSTILNPVATPLDTTTYMLTVTDKYGCSFALNYTVNTRGSLVGRALVSVYKDLDVVVFPNPNDGKFKVRIAGEPAEKIELVIFDNNGRMIKRHVVSNFIGDHTEVLNLILTSGIYNLRVDSGSSKLSRQFIIQ